MVKRSVFFVMIISVLLVCSVSALKHDNRVVGKFSSDNDMSKKVGVIVYLKNDSLKLGLSAKGADETTDLSKYKMKRKFIYSDAISLDINETELQELLNNSDVDHVEVETQFHALLQDSVPLINATKTWALQSNGMNLTGLGQTVCIIDSGVNYTHSDLGGCYGNNNASSGCKVIGGYDYVNNDADPMDDDGHGTHVTGIVSANGAIMGVAPDSKIIAIKVLNASGSGTTGNILAGMDWCINNATRFNISVISMSLGDAGNYVTYCDSIYPDFSSEINSAIAKNITVVVASGNGYNYTAISLPACIRNATAVGATDKSDVIAPYSSRSSIMTLFAPGTNIFSTWFNGGYAVGSGTSMATPHVAGAFAIANEYLNSVGRKKTPKQLESTFNATGKQITDISSGLVYSRINVYNAITALDADKPVVSLVSPANGTLLSGVNQMFRCNSTDLALTNVTFYLWNSTSLYNQTSTGISGPFYLYEINVSNMVNDNYKWNCLFTDANGNYAEAAGNYSLFGNIMTNLISPANGSYTNSGTNFSCESQSEGKHALSNVTFYLWNSTKLIYNKNITISGFDNTTTFNYTLALEDNYKWNCLSYNNNSNYSYAQSNYSLVYDITKPNLTVISPSEGYSATGTQNIEFDFNTSDNFDVANCSFGLSSDDAVFDTVNEVGSTLYSISPGNYVGSITYSLSPGSYNWNISCIDYAGNINESSSRSFIVNPSPVNNPGGSGSGGGGGGGSMAASVYTISTNQMVNGFSAGLGGNDEVRFGISSGGGGVVSSIEGHKLIVNGLGENFANITISSSPVNFVLYVGEEKKLNLTSAEYYDLLVKLNDITNNKANITLREINEQIIKKSVPVNNSAESFGVSNSGTNNSGKSNNPNYEWYIAAMVIFVIVFIIYYIYLNAISARRKLHRIRRG